VGVIGENSGVKDNGCGGNNNASRSDYCNNNLNFLSSHSFLLSVLPVIIPAHMGGLLKMVSDTIALPHSACPVI
jgi:hypothetical protein